MLTLFFSLSNVFRLQTHCIHDIDAHLPNTLSLVSIDESIFWVCWPTDVWQGTKVHFFITISRKRVFYRPNSLALGGSWCCLMTYLSILYLQGIESPWSLNTEAKCFFILPRVLWMFLAIRQSTSFCTGASRAFRKDGSLTFLFKASRSKRSGHCLFVFLLYFFIFMTFRCTCLLFEAIGEPMLAVRNVLPLWCQDADESENEEKDEMNWLDDTKQWRIRWRFGIYKKLRREKKRVYGYDDMKMMTIMFHFF